MAVAPPCYTLSASRALWCVQVRMAVVGGGTREALVAGGVEPAFTASKVRGTAACKLWWPCCATAGDALGVCRLLALVRSPLVQASSVLLHLPCRQSGEYMQG